MIRRLTIFFLFIFVARYSSAQVINIDSLRQELHVPKHDTDMVYTMDWLSFQFNVRDQYDSSLYYANAALELSERINYEKGKGYSYINLGNYYSYFTDYSKAVNYYSEAKRIMEKYGDSTQIPNMILQPYIENAIWHGLSHKQGDRKLQIRINNENGLTRYEIEDNGVGRKKAAGLKSLYRKEHKSKGMELLSKRFKLLAKEFGSDIKTEITDVMKNGEVKGTLVSVSVPHSLTYQSLQQQ